MIPSGRAVLILEGRPRSNIGRAMAKKTEKTRRPTAARAARGRRYNTILYVMFDQLAPQFLPSYGHKLVKAPNLERLAAEGVLFENAYSNSPLCAPARFSMMAGQLCQPHRRLGQCRGVPAPVPTFAHYLRLPGYRTCLSGKMHFVGPDQLHGFEERVTTDIYPGDFGWTPTGTSRSIFTGGTTTC